MFDIRIGTILPAEHAVEMMPLLRPIGFEGYELTCGSVYRGADIAESAKRVLDAAEGLPISALGCYGNTLADAEVRGDIEQIIDNAALFGCGTVSVFAGALPDTSVPDTVPAFKKVFSELCARAADAGVTLAIENCPMGTSWRRGGGQNIAFCPDAWEMLFDAVPCENLGLEWEPCHALMQLMDPIAQLRKWAPRVKHVHGKDGTVAWDIIRERGISSGAAFGWNRTPGFGDTNWNDVCTILLMNGYTGFIDIEGYHDPVHYDTGEWSAQLRAVNYLKDCRGGREYIDCPIYRGYQPPKKQK